MPTTDCVTNQQKYCRGLATSIRAQAVPCSIGPLNIIKIRLHIQEPDWRSDLPLSPFCSVKFLITIYGIYLIKYLWPRRVAINSTSIQLILEANWKSNEKHLNWNLNVYFGVKLELEYNFTSWLNWHQIDRSLVMEIGKHAYAYCLNKGRRIRRGKEKIGEERKKPTSLSHLSCDSNPGRGGV